MWAVGLVLDDLLFLLFCLPFAIAAAFILLRHVWLALLVSIAPLPGLLAIVWVFHIGWSPAYGFGFCAGLLTAMALTRRLLSGNGDWRSVAWAATGAALTRLGFFWYAKPGIPFIQLFDWLWCLLPLAGAGAAVLLTVAGWRHMAFDEAFVARANRVAETRTRVLAVLGYVAVPRWALAWSGVAVVMAVLSWFQAAPSRHPDYLSLAVLMTAMGGLARDWRAILAAGLCGAMLWLFRCEHYLPFFALPALLLAASARTHEEEGSEAWRLSLEEGATCLLPAALAVLLVLAISQKSEEGLLVLGGLVAFTAALIFFPALTVALWTILPRRRSVEELYRG